MSEGRGEVARRGLVERAWCCSQCGKWSHAITRPVSHRRFISMRDGLPSGLRVLSVVEPTHYDKEGRALGGGWFVACGPFNTYELRMVGPDAGR